MFDFERGIGKLDGTKKQDGRTGADDRRARFARMRIAPREQSAINRLIDPLRVS
jgi:hypothetical protein